MHGDLSDIPVGQNKRLLACPLLPALILLPTFLDVLAVYGGQKQKQSQSVAWWKKRTMMEGSGQMHLVRQSFDASLS